MDIIQILLIIPPALLGLVLHEVAHGAVAWSLGDPTARQMGRLTLNPLKHLDPIGTLMIFVVHFGWAKPVIVRPEHFRNPRRDMLLVSLAGPFTNFLLAAAFALILRSIGQMQNLPVGLALLAEMLYMGTFINVALGLFNLLPVPPLDGSRLIYAVWPVRYERSYRMFERVASLALVAVIIYGAVTKTATVSRVILQPLRAIVAWLTGIEA